MDRPKVPGQVIGPWNALLGWVRRHLQRPPSNPQTGLRVLK
jgi:hypothetical protein